jgi:hypothetical protein
MIQIQKVNFKGYANSWQVSNGDVEVVVTGDIGPRIMRYGFPGGQNFFKVFEEQMGKTGEPAWQPRGGHRVWIAPEDPVKSYAPDNEAVQIDVQGDVITATGPVEAITGIEKKLIVKMAPSGTSVEVIHELRNAGREPYRLATWVLTMLAQGGAGIHGFPGRGTHPEMLEPTNPLVMWAFTHLDDPRWRLSRKYLVLRQDPANALPQKLGTHNARTWAAYHLNGDLFVKRYQASEPFSSYPDMGCSFETFTNADFLELETLGPIVMLAPGQSVSHKETWSAHRKVELQSWSDAELDAVVLPLVG